MTTDELQTLLQSADLFAVAERIQRDGTPEEIVKRYTALAKDLYWKAKDAAAAMAVCRAGLLYCITKSVESTGDAARSLRELAKPLAFDAASFAWPGWAEPGITLTEVEIATGRDAAKLNLRLAIELSRPPKGMSNAYWMIGAYALVDRNTDAAVGAFNQAAAISEQIPDPAAAAMNRAYAALARLLADRNLAGEFDEAVKQLDEMATEDATFYAQQLQTARTYFVQAK